MKKGKKALLIAEIVIGILFIAGIGTAVLLQLFIPENEIAIWFRDNVLNLDNLGAGMKARIPVIISSAIYFVLIYAVCKIIRTIFNVQMKKSLRAKTVINLIDGFIKYGSAIALIIVVLRACGVNTAALLASVGVLALIVGIGAQSLIADIIAGIFIIFENEYEVGEIISIDNFRGTVMEIGIRSTQVLDMAGNIKIINNSDISNVVNMSRELSLANVDCEFPYDVPLEFVENLIKKNLEAFSHEISGIVEGPFYKGISYYGESNVAVKIVARCKEADRFQVQRDLLRAYRQMIVANGIDLSYPQVVINQAKENDISVTKREKTNAQRFIDAQREASQDMETQENS